MRNLIICCLLFSFMGCFPLIQSFENAYVPAYYNKYDDLIPADESKIFSDYTSLVTLREDGIYIERKFYPDSRTEIAYQEYKDKELNSAHGKSMKWSDYGVLTNESNFSDGKKVGLEKNYQYKTGKLISKGEYSDNEKQGIWTYYIDGRLQEEIAYLAGKKEGNFVVYNDEGELAAKGTYTQDSLIESNIFLAGDWGSHRTMEDVDEKLPLFGDGCPELSEYQEKKKCSETKMLQFIYKNLRYPSSARENDLQGMAIAKFVVDSEGQVMDIDVVKGLCDDIRNEVSRVIYMMPSWVPGEKDGKKVKVLYTLPVRFKLEG